MPFQPSSLARFQSHFTAHLLKSTLHQFANYDVMGDSAKTIAETSNIHSSPHPPSQPPHHINLLDSLGMISLATAL